LNPIDFKIAAGNLGGVAPLPIFPGTDCSGVVERVGSRVSSLQVGDEVFGNGFGFLADLAAVKADRLAPKPKSWSFERAAALPTVGLTTSVVLAASPGLAGKSVVVVGASGGVGTLALQAARAAGAARIYAVCSGRNADFVRGLGADEVLDYTLGDWTRTFREGNSEAPAYVWDVSPAGGQSVWDSVSGWLPASSTLVSINFFDPSFTLSPGNIFNQFTLFPAANRALNMLGQAPSYRFVDATSVVDPRRALLEMAESADRGDLRMPSVEAFAFENFHRAAAKLMGGHVRGKVVVTI